MHTKEYLSFIHPLYRIQRFPDKYLGFRFFTKQSEAPGTAILFRITSKGIKDLGPQTKKGASIIVMAVVGGAVFPPLMEHISDLYSMSVGFLAPIPLFMFILYYAMKGHHVKIEISHLETGG